MSARAALVCALLAAASVRGAEPSVACKVLVLNLEGRALPDEDKELPALLTETLANEMGAVSGCSVISAQEIHAMMDYEKTKAVCTDGSDSCLAEIGQAYGADRVVAGTLGKLGKDYLLSVRLMNVRNGAVDRRAEQPVTSQPEDLRRAAKNAARQLFDVALLPAPAAAPAAAGSPVLLWTGAAVALLGAVATVGGGVALGVAETQLANPEQKDKDGSKRIGQVSLVAVGVGALLLVVGGAVAVLGIE